MSTFMAFACVDLFPEAELDGFLATLERGVARAPDASEPLMVNLVEGHGGHRVTLYANYGNIWLGHVLLAAAAATGAVRRAVVGLDHDEYGIEHAVFDGRDGQLCRVQHVYVYPDGEPDEEFGLTFTEVPVRDGVPVNPDGSVDGPASWAVVAALFDVPPQRNLSRSLRQVDQGFFV